MAKFRHRPRTGARPGQRRVDDPAGPAKPPAAKVKPPAAQTKPSAAQAKPPASQVQPAELPRAPQQAQQPAQSAAQSPSRQRRDRSDAPREDSVQATAASRSTGADLVADSARAAGAAGVGAGPRLAALRTLDIWAKDDSRLASELIAESGLAGRDLGLARELALGALRHRRLYDWLADQHLQRAPDGRTRDALRILAHQIFSLERVPAHAAVASTLDAHRGNGGHRSVGLLNAIGRKWLRLRRDDRTNEAGPLATLPDAARPDDHAILYSVPAKWYTSLNQQRVALDGDWRGFLAPAPLCLRWRRGQPPADLSEQPGFLRQEGNYSWWSQARAVLKRWVEPGLAAVQDFSQGQAVAALAARPGEVILDMCSAPGGKSAALADMGARVVACDSNLLRLAKVGNLFTEATEFPRVVMDGTRPAFAPESFDAVLVDAPCSNTGVLARRVEAKWRQQDEPGLITLQQKLLQSAAALVKPGGRLVYATCSLLPQENEAIAASLPGWSTEHAATIWPNQWQAGGYHARLVRDS